MNLLVVSAWFPYPPSNGSKTRAYHLLRELSAQHPVRLLTFAEPGESSPEAVAALRAFCESVEVVPGNPAKAPAKLKVSGLLSTTPRAYHQGFSPTMRRLVEERASAADVVIGFQVTSSLYLEGIRRPRLLEELEVTSIIQQRDQATGLSRWRAGLTVQKLAWFVRRLSRDLEHLTVVSEIERRAVVGMGCDPARVSVVPNGADPTDLRRPLTPPMADTVIYPGAPTYGANLDAIRWFVREIWPRVRARKPGARFLVTGSTDGADLETLPSSPGVEFAGFVSDIKGTIAACAACVVPLRLGGGTRLKVLEALALGTPIVATHKAVEGLAVEDGAHLLIADTPEGVSDRLVQLFDDRGLADRLRSSGRALVAERYTWPRIAAGLGVRLLELAS